MLAGLFFGLMMLEYDDGGFAHVNWSMCCVYVLCRFDETIKCMDSAQTGQEELYMCEYSVSIAVLPVEFVV